MTSVYPPTPFCNPLWSGWFSTIVSHTCLQQLSPKMILTLGVVARNVFRGLDFSSPRDLFELTWLQITLKNYLDVGHTTA